MENNSNGDAGGEKQSKGSPSAPVVDEHQAAIIIQSTFRGFKTRKGFEETKGQSMDASGEPVVAATKTESTRKFLLTFFFIRTVKKFQIDEIRPEKNLKSCQ
jgi:hypothetical protein